MSAEKFRTGDRVLVVEGTHTGVAGPVTRVFKAYRSGRLEKLLTVDGGGTFIDVRQAFVRMDSAQAELAVGEVVATDQLAAQLLEALVLAKHTIRNWHDMRERQEGSTREMSARAWELYLNSPEMKQINAAIAAAQGV